MLSLNETSKAWLATALTMTHRLIACLALLASFLIPVRPAQAVEQPDLSDDCYGPTKPLTPELRAAFVAEIRPLAANAERDHGIPAPIFAAMAIHESGYGTTRLAIAANNLLSYKWPGPSGPDGRTVYELTCQPKEDKGRIYVVFRDHADAIDFVAGRLAAARYYNAATKKYRMDLAAGKERKDAAIGWFKTIAPTYNPYHTDDYVRTVLALANDPISLSDHVDPAATLWTLAAAQTPANQSASSMTPLSSDVEKVMVWFENDSASRYWISGATCRPERSSAWKGYEALPDGAIQRCQYTVTSCADLRGSNRSVCEANRRVAGPKSATIIVLEPSSERMSRWIASACAIAGGKRDLCLQKVYDAGVDMGNWQIPIAGLGYEDIEPRFVQVAYAFRDGLTVRADRDCGWDNGWPDGEKPPSADQDATCSKPNVRPSAVSFQARPARTTRTDVYALDPTDVAGIPAYPEKFPIPDPAADVWRTFVREALVKAYTSDDNILVTAKAVALRRAGNF